MSYPVISRYDSLDDVESVEAFMDSVKETLIKCIMEKDARIQELTVEVENLKAEKEKPIDGLRKSIT
jgi:uncharacterized small protein (DUF1192 family)